MLSQECSKLQGIGSLFGCISGLCFAVTAVFAKLLNKTVDAVYLSWTRYICMTLLTLTLLVAKRAKCWQYSREIHSKIVGLSLGGIVITTSLIYSAQIMDLSISITLFSTFPIFVAIFSRLILKKELGKTDIGSIVICIIGVVLCIQPHGHVNVMTEQFALGSGLALFAAILNGANLTIFQTLESVEVLDFTMLESSIACFFLTIYHIIIGKYTVMTTRSDFSMIFLNGIASWLAIIFIFAGIKLDSAVLTSIGRTTEIGFGVLFNSLVFHSNLNGLNVTGIVVITVGVLIPVVSNLFQKKV